VQHVVKQGGFARTQEPESTVTGKRAAERIGSFACIRSINDTKYHFGWQKIFAYLAATRDRASRTRFMVTLKDKRAVRFAFMHHFLTPAQRLISDLNGILYQL
jgi:hypothetical protein